MGNEWMNSSVTIIKKRRNNVATVRTLVAVYHQIHFNAEANSIEQNAIYSSGSGTCSILPLFGGPIFGGTVNWQQEAFRFMDLQRGVKLRLLLESLQGCRVVKNLSKIS